LSRRANSPGNDTRQDQPSVRCAIYTRKSTEEGLDQDFNSLDAQRESAEAYIQSQKHEGWTCLPDRYDDGGFSGGNIERPALKRLLADVEAGKIDCLMVYKVDRLSRSILDFSRLMETLERHNVSFVSVTQQFNTTNSMGRLTLNILLSFAQFEREIIAERTRDKMSAARRKGKWIGGNPALGYDVDPRGGRLIVNESESVMVRSIFELYLEKRALLPTVQELNRRGWTTKRWITKKAGERGGRPFDKSILSRMLSNVLYLGKINFQGEIIEGEHEAILSEEVWTQVQETRRRHIETSGASVRNKHGALLKGLLFCGPCGTAMSHKWTIKKNQRRYHYYVCTTAEKQGWDSCPTKSLPAPAIESFVVERIRCIGEDPTLVAETLHQTRAQNKKRVEELESEKKLLEGELKQLDTQVRKLIQGMTSDGNGAPRTTARLADLQDRIRMNEQRATNIREELLAKSAELVDERDLASALSLFDPVWESLSSQEQTRVMRLLVERVVYDGTNETLAITFRPTGIKALAGEMNVQGGGKRK